MALILIIEDEIEMAMGLKDNFEFDGYQVLLAHDGEQGQEMALRERPDLIILDLMLPKKSGFDVCRALRSHQGMKTPIIMLTARGQEIDKVLGLELGADDYVTKPFSVRELLARAKAVLRRYSDKVQLPENVTQIGKISVDFEHYIARDENGEIELTHKEFEILKYLLDHKGQTITRYQLLDQVWGYEAYPATRTVDNFMVKLRKLVEVDPNHPKHILTVYGVGYKYV